MRILVVRLGAMGDVIHALPAVAALRASFPEATIGWVIEERWIDLLSPPNALDVKCGDGAAPRPNAGSDSKMQDGAQPRPHTEMSRSFAKPLVDQIHTVNTRAWRKALLSAATRKESLGAIKSIRDAKYDVAIDFQGAWKSGLIAKLSGAPVRIGFSRPRERGAALFYTKRIAAQRPHVIEQNLELAAAIEATSAAQSAPLLPANPAAEAWADKVLRERGLDRFAIINPGAGWGAKRWPAENYAAVARGLCDLGLRSVINFGPAEEGLAKEVEAACAGAAVAIPCSIGELIAITRRARLFVGGDTGPMHLAAALQVPVVGIFGPTDPARNGPFATSAIVLRRAGSVTNHSRRAAPDEAMLAITPEEVLTAARELLQHSPQVSGEAPNA
jgi:heptosyltransferase-1